MLIANAISARDTTPLHAMHGVSATNCYGTCNKPQGTHAFVPPEPTGQQERQIKDSYIKPGSEFRIHTVDSSPSAERRNMGRPDLNMENTHGIPQANCYSSDIPLANWLTVGNSAS